MNRTAIAFSTKDRVELSKQSFVPLDPRKHDVFVVDGSKTEEGIRYAENLMAYADIDGYLNVTGGADAAIAFNLSTLLRHPNKYDYVGLVENDVLLDPDWFERSMELFARCRADGIEAGAVSARCYTDRILFSRPGYCVMHNLGAGMVIFTRQAAQLVLDNFRTGFTTENRRVFNQVSGLDIARTSNFVRDPHITCADWQFDRVLAEHGLASLALTPSKCQMIGQVPPLEEQGLHLAGPDDDLSHFESDKAFETFRERTCDIREGRLQLPDGRFLRDEQGNVTIMPHQVPMLGGWYEGDWQLKWVQGFGPFAYRSHIPFGQEIMVPEGSKGPAHANVVCPISGPCSLLVSGGETGGKVCVADEASGYEMTIDVQPETSGWMNLSVPGTVTYRNVRLTALTPSICFHGIVCRDPQPVVPGARFDHSQLPLP